MNDLICKPWLDLQEEILENRKTYKQFEKEISEGLMDDVKKEIENGEMYEIVANTIMISKWTGIRKSTASHMKAIEKKGKQYIIRYDMKKKKTIPPITDADTKFWKGLVANKDVKKI